MASVWSDVDTYYADSNDMEKAEEVFSFIAESVELGDALDSVRDRILSALRRLMVSTGFIKSPVNLNDIGRESRIIARGIRSGRLQQKNFPASDNAQFRLHPLARLSDALKNDKSINQDQIEALSKIGPETVKESVAARFASIMDNLGLKLQQGLQH
jgi:hypothetical protein